MTLVYELTGGVVMLAAITALGNTLDPETSATLTRIATITTLGLLAGITLGGAYTVFRGDN